MAGELGDLGARLREERERARISQRELARRLGVSASLISQIESGQSKPSVSTLYAIVTELGVSLDYVFRVHEDELSVATAVGAETDSADVEGPVVHPTERHVVELASGVIWERLTSHEHEDVDFLHVIYDVGGSSSPDERLMRHPGASTATCSRGGWASSSGSSGTSSGPATRSRSTRPPRTDSGTSATRPCTGSGSSSDVTARHRRATGAPRV